MLAVKLNKTTLQLNSIVLRIDKHLDWYEQENRDAKICIYKYTCNHENLNEIYQVSISLRGVKERPTTS